MNITSDPSTIGPFSATVTAGSTTASVTVTGLNDLIYHPGGERKYTLTFTPEEKGAYGAHLAEPVSLTVRDNEVADTASKAIELRQDKIDVKEGGGSKSLTVTLDGGDPGSDVPVTVTFVSNTLTASALIFKTGTDWNTNQSKGKELTISTTEDSDINGDDFEVATVSASSYRSTALYVTIKDDDRPALTIWSDIDASTTLRGTVRLTETAESVESSKTYYLKLDPAPTSEVTVYVQSSNPEVAMVTGSVTVEASASISEPVTVTAVPNEVDDGNRSVDIIHTIHATDDVYADIDSKKVRVTVTDDDTKGLNIGPLYPEEGVSDDGSNNALYGVSLNSQPESNVVVTIMSDTNIATTEPSQLIFTPDTDTWKIPLDVTVTGVNGSGDRTATIRNMASGGGYDNVSANVTVKVTDVKTPGITLSESEMSVEEGTPETYTVKLDVEPEGGSVTVTMAVSPSYATVSPSVLTFASTDWSTPKRVTVTGDDDRVVSAPRIATITHAASGADYGGQSRSLTVTVTDNDADVTVSSTSVTVSEAGGTDHTATYTLKLAGQPTGPVTVAVASSGASAARVSPTALTFTTANWDTAQTVTVTAVDNQTDDGASRTATITHTFNGGGFDGVTNTVAVTVTDNDGIVVSSPTPAKIPEAGGTATYTVKLESQPAGSVTVAVKSSDEKAATVSPSTLTFTSSNGTTAQTVTVTGVPDDVDNAGDKRPVTITHTPSGYGTSAETKTVTVTVKDDDAAPEGITLSVAPSMVEENDGATRITVTATVNGTTRYADAKSITVAVGASGDSAREGTDYQPVGAVPGAHSCRRGQRHGDVHADAGG